MGSGLSVALMLVCLLIGFLLGTRGRQIVAAIKAAGQAIKSLSFKIPMPASLMGQSQTQGEDDGEKNEEDETDENEIGIDDFIQPSDADNGLNDHPDIHLSPVLLYKIKRSKEELRAQQRRAALLAEGFDEGEVEERMALEKETGGGGGGRANPLALLISVGARVEATAGGDSAEAAKVQERRRLQRNVDQFLLRVDGIEKFRADEKDEKVHIGRVKTAFEVARETAIRPIGGPAREREVANLHRAKDARNLLREWQKQNPIGEKGSLLQIDYDENDDEAREELREEGVEGEEDEGEEEGGEEGGEEGVDA